VLLKGISSRPRLVPGLLKDFLNFIIIFLFSLNEKKYYLACQDYSN